MKHIIKPLVIFSFILIYMSFEFVGANFSQQPPPQQEVNDTNMFFVLVEELPEYIGGEEARQKFLKENLVYPKKAQKANIEGRVILSFIVETDGNLTNFEIVKNAHPILDKEALRVAKLMTKWKSGKQRGKEVRVKYTMPITFTLN